MSVPGGYGCEDFAWSIAPVANRHKGEGFEASQSGDRIGTFLQPPDDCCWDPTQWSVGCIGKISQRVGILCGERLVHPHSKLELCVGHGLAIGVQGGQLIRLKLSESVKWFNPGERINTEELHVLGILMPQARENVYLCNWNGF